MAANRDPEVEQLTQSIRQAVGRARTLSEQLAETVAELETFRDDVATLRENMNDRWSPRGGYLGQERR